MAIFDQRLYYMNRRTRSVLRALAVLLVLVAVLMELNIVIIPALAQLRFWAVVVAFGIMLATAK